MASCLSDTRLVEAWPTVTRWPLSVISSRPDGFQIQVGRHVDLLLANSYPARHTLVENQPLTQKIARTTGLGVETNCAGLRSLASDRPTTANAEEPIRVVGFVGERTGLLTRRIGNPSLSGVECGFPAITEPLLDDDYFPHGYILRRTATQLVRIGARRGAG